MNMDGIRKLLEDNDITGSACDFLVLLWGMIQFFDDVFDGDPVKDFDRVLYASLLSLPLNEFYSQYRAALAPAIHMAIEKWHMANSRESAATGDARTFMWRAAYWDVAGTVCSITNNPNMRTVIALYAESYEEYLLEVNNA